MGHELFLTTTKLCSLIHDLSFVLQLRARMHTNLQAVKNLIQVHRFIYAQPSELIADTWEEFLSLLKTIVFIEQAH